MNVLATEPGLPLLGLAVTAPTIIVLFVGAFYFARDRGQRLVNLICGFLGAVVSILIFVFTYEPAPNSWADEAYGLFVIALAPVGAAIGLVLCVSWRLHHRPYD